MIFLSPWLYLFACEKSTDVVAVDSAPETDSGTTEIVNDSDGDGILDIHEGDEDPDEDGLPNSMDDDSDGDGIPDSIEAGDDDLDTFPIDSDEDGIYDYLDEDSDDNGIPDGQEAGSDPESPRDTDSDGVPDFQDDDNDGDEILDTWEMDFTPGAPPDTDRDGISDYMDLDSDGDTLCDIWEGGTTYYRPEPVDTDEDGTYDYRDQDSDNDGFSDTDEAGAGPECAEPLDHDLDGDYSSADLDSDGDGLSDVEESENYGTDPYDRDSDGDGQSDGAEHYAGTNPNNPSDFIEGVYVEISERTSSEQTFEFELKIQYGDIGFLLDTTGSMGSTLTAAASRFSSIANALEGNFEDMAFGVAEFDDYNYGGMGSGSDKPFVLKQQITDDLGSVESALSSLYANGGSDSPESDMEALYQAATGIGYDQDCNGVYDSSDDVPPFVPSAGDAFGGSSTGTYDSAGLGELGGMGFRERSLVVLFYATDIYIRDPQGSGSATDTPGGCPGDAGSADVVSALASIGGYVIGVDVSSYGPGNSNGPYDQMEDLAWATNSVADLDEDGVADEPLVFSVAQAGSDFEEQFEENVVLAVEQLVAKMEYERVHLEIEGDEWGLVESVVPEEYNNIDPDEVDTLEFQLNFVGTIAATQDDQLFTMTLNIIGDDSILLDTYDIVVVVPGNRYTE